MQIFELRINICWQVAQFCVDELFFLLLLLLLDMNPEVLHVLHTKHSVLNTTDEF